MSLTFLFSTFHQYIRLDKILSLAKLEEGVLTVTLPKIEAEAEPKKKVVVEDDAENEKDATYITPEGSDEEETREYVNISVH